MIEHLSFSLEKKRAAYFVQGEIILEGQVTDVAKKRIQMKKHERMQPQECHRWHKESADKTAMHLFFLALVKVELRNQVRKAS